MAVALVLLMVCFPSCARLVETAIASVSLTVFTRFLARLAGMAIAPVSLIVCLPPFMHGSLGWPLLQFHSCCLPLSCEACLDGRCSGFTHGMFTLFHARHAGTAVAPVLLMPAVALVFSMQRLPG